MNADTAYQNYIKTILQSGDKIKTRNSETLSCINLPPITFTSAPLVQLRKTAWKKAISEMEWFLSGNPICPDNLLDWWNGQLDPNGQLLGGYGHQLRCSSYQIEKYPEYFDQVEFILNGLKNNPNSRRLLMTTWNPGDMAYITEVNQNPNTPTCCHSTIIQFFVRNNELHMKSYQRSADMLLGVPHNWIQSWAMLLYFAHHSGLKAGSMRWDFGDAHIYLEESHLEAANQISVAAITACSFSLEYAPYQITPDRHDPSIPAFLASDFKCSGEISIPCTTIRPKLI